MNNNKEILLMSYWEHFKAQKDLALIYPPDNKRRKQIEATLIDLQNKLHE